MPFKREPLDHDLPADLELLGQQLADDARRLAERYPPALLAGDRLRERASRSDSPAWLRGFAQNRGAQLAAAGCVCVALSLAVWLAARGRGTLHAVEQPRLVAGSGEGSLLSAERGQAEQGENDAGRHAPAERQASARPNEAVGEPATWLRGLTGPELEGVLDLIEQPAAAAVVSI